MASKAYVASMTVAELTSELKQRGLSARGKKRDLQNRLEKALEEEELSDSGSESDGNNNQQLFQQAAAYAAYQTTPGMNNLTVSINRAEMVPSDAEIDSDHANQTQELIVSIQRSKQAIQHVEGSSNDAGGQQIELNGDGNKLEPGAVDLVATSADISAVDIPPGADEVCQIANNEPKQDELPTSEADSNQHAEEKEPEDVHMQQPISSPPDCLPTDTDNTRPSPSTSEQVQITNLSPGSSQLPPLVDDLQPSSSSSIPSQPLSASPSEDVQPSSYSQALPDETKQLLLPIPPTTDIPQPSSTELQPSSSMSSPPLKSPPLSSPPNISPMIAAPDTINQESAVSELIPTARSLFSSQDKIPESSEAAGPSESKQSSSQPCSLEGEEMQVSGETTEQQAITEEEPLAPSVGVEPDDVGKAENKEEEPDTSSMQERAAQISLPSLQVDSKEASPSTPPPPVEKEMEDINAHIAADSREPTSTSELPTTTKIAEVKSGAASQSEGTEDHVVTELSSVVPNPSTTSTSYVDSGKPSGEDELILQGVVSSSGVEPAGIDADVVVPTVEEDDFSVFSAEAAEAQRLRSSANETVSSKRRLSSGNNSVSMSASNRLGRETYERDTSQEHKDTNLEVSSNSPVQKRRRISTSPKRASTGERKRRWGSTSGRVQLTPHAAISSDTLEDIIPEEVKAESSNQSTALDVVMSYSGDEGDKAANENMERGEEEDVLDIGGKEGLIDDEYEREWRLKEKEREEQRREAERARQELETRRRIEARLKAKQEGEITHEEMDTREKASPRSPSPAQNSPTHIVHVEHLTRPFTILQLKDLLEEDGKMVEAGFWTNRIKSHCIVVYESVDSAIATRNRIHGMKWPSTNPKLLKADYLSAREVAQISDGQLELQETSLSPQPEVQLSPEAADQQPRTVSPNELSEDQPVEKTDDKISDQKPTLVLDKLFHKTKATPPIYWLPLTDEQAKVKEDERKAIEDERQRLRAERVKEREKEKERSEREMRDRERRIREEREQRARDRYRRRSRSRSRSPRRRR